MFLVSCTPVENGDDASLAGQAFRVAKKTTPKVSPSLDPNTVSVNCPGEISVPLIYSIKNDYVANLVYSEKWNYDIYLDNSAKNNYVEVPLKLGAVVEDIIDCAYNGPDLGNIDLRLTTTFSQLGVSSCSKTSESSFSCS